MAIQEYPTVNPASSGLQGKMGEQAEVSRNQARRTETAPPASAAATDIPENFLANLLLKHAFYLEVFTLPELTQRLKLNSATVMRLLEYLRREKYVDIKAPGSFNGSATAISQNYRYGLTETGKRWTAQLLDYDSYVGPTPVTLENYWRQVEAQSIRQVQITRRQLTQGFSGLVIWPDLIRQLGPALISGRPIFIYGPPGNGKTAISLRLGELFTDTILVPYAIYVEGNVIRVFDAVTHRPVPEEGSSLLKTDPRSGPLPPPHGR